MKWYTLNEQGEPVQSTIEEANQVFTSEARLVAKTKTPEVTISTVFLAIDHSLSSDPNEILWWETMTFSDNPDLDQLQTRCGGSREQAEAMHQEMCDNVLPKS